MITLGAALGRPVTAPPGVPEERVAALREAFVAMTKDPGLLVEASAMRMEIEPLRGQDMQQMISQVLATPARVAARAKEFLE
jgi:tripartite-type tricarboxylate transporter receptor subunit TctC